MFSRVTDVNINLNMCGKKKRCFILQLVSICVLIAITFTLGNRYCIGCEIIYKSTGTYVNSTYTSKTSSNDSLLNAIEEVLLENIEIKYEQMQFDDFQLHSKRSNLDLYRNISNIDGSVATSTVCGSHQTMASGKHTKILFLNYDGDKGELTVQIQVYNWLNQQKRSGGDVIFVRAMSAASLPGKLIQPLTIAARVVDNEDGTYTAYAKPHWTGSTAVKARIGSKFENWCRRFRAMSLYGDSVFSIPNPHSIFVEYEKNGLTQTERCSATPTLSLYNATCNFTAQNYNMSFYCGYPSNQNLDCSNTILKAITRPFPKLNNVTDSLVVPPFTEMITDTLVLDVASRTNITTSAVKCRNRAALETWREQSPTGQGINGGWKMLHCVHRQLRNRTEIRRCLSRKRLLFLGDSTVRQYFDRLVRMVNKSAKIEKKMNGLKYFDTTLPMVAEWQVHEMPYHCGTSVSLCVPGSIAGAMMNVASVYNETTDSDIVLVITYNAHLQNYPPDVLESRLKSIIEPLKYLKRVHPRAKVFFKGPHPVSQDRKWFDIRISLMYREVLISALKDVLNDVVYLDTFSIGIAYDDLSLHPVNPMMQAQIDQLFGYIC